MMRKNWLRIAIVGVVIAALAGGVVLAQGPQPGMAQMQVRQAAAMMVKELGLTAEQVQQVRAIFGGAQDELAQLQEALRITRLKLELALVEKVGEGKLKAAIQDTVAAGKAIEDFRAAQIAKAFQILTPEQQAKVLLKNRQDWWRLLVDARVQVQQRNQGN